MSATATGIWNVRKLLCAGLRRRRHLQSSLSINWPRIRRSTFGSLSFFSASRESTTCILRGYDQFPQNLNNVHLFAHFVNSAIDGFVSTQTSYTYSFSYLPTDGNCASKQQLRPEGVFNACNGISLPTALLGRDYGDVCLRASTFETDYQYLSVIHRYR